MQERERSEKGTEYECTRNNNVLREKDGERKSVHESKHMVVRQTEHEVARKGHEVVRKSTRLQESV